MADSRLHGDALNKDKRNSQNAWIPTTHWVGGFVWHYIQRANRENFLYDLHCIDGESMQFTKYSEGQFYGWHNDAGLATQYKPVSVGNRQDDLPYGSSPRQHACRVNFVDGSAAPFGLHKNTNLCVRAFRCVSY